MNEVTIGPWKPHSENTKVTELSPYMNYYVGRNSWKGVQVPILRCKKMNADLDIFQDKWKSRK